MIETSAPAKIILFGEHAVVHEQPAIAVPVSGLRASASAIPQAPGSGLRIVAADLNETIPFDIGAELVDNALLQTVRLFLQTTGLPAPDLTITLHSQIPMASGLGSGAAVAAALTRALNQACGSPLNDEQINALVYEIEKLHHGTPSGIDNTVIVYEQPVYFQRQHPIERIRIAAPLHLLVADTGRGALTKIAVGDVRSLYEREPARIGAVLDSIGALVREARAALESGNISALGPLMCRNHEYLQTLTVSSPELDTLVAAAVAAGALGAKLSGGGRGGNMISLVTPEIADAVESALFHAGAVRVFRSIIH